MILNFSLIPILLRATS